MNPRALSAFAAIALISLAAWLMNREPAVPPEVAIRAALDRAASAANEKNLEGVVEILSDRFKGPSGSTKSDAKRIVFLQLRQGDWNRVFFARTEVTVDQSETQAKVDTHAVLARGQKAEKLEDVVLTSASIYEFNLEMELEGKEWKIVQADYHPAQLLSLD